MILQIAQEFVYTAQVSRVTALGSDRQFPGTGIFLLELLCKPGPSVFSGATHRVRAQYRLQAPDKHC